MKCLSPLDVYQTAFLQQYGRRKLQPYLQNHSFLLYGYRSVHGTPRWLLQSALVWHYDRVIIIIASKGYTAEYPRVELDRVLFNASAAAGTTHANGRALAAQFSAFQILDEDAFQLPHGRVVILDELRQLPNLAANVDAGGWVWHLYGIEDGLDALIGLVLLRDVHDRQCSSVEGLQVFWGSEPCMAEPGHFLPVHIHEANNEECDEVGNRNVCVEDVAANITDGEHTKDVPALRPDILQVVSHVYGDEDGTCEQCDCSE